MLRSSFSLPPWQFEFFFKLATFFFTNRQLLFTIICGYYFINPVSTNTHTHTKWPTITSFFFNGWSDFTSSAAQNWLHLFIVCNLWLWNEKSFSSGKKIYAGEKRKQMFYKFVKLKTFWRALSRSKISFSLIDIEEK